LNAGILCAGIMMVVFLEMFLPVFSALFLIVKLPNPLRYTFSPFDNEFLTASMKASTVACTATFSIPVLFAISATISAFVITQ